MALPIGPSLFHPVDATPVRPLRHAPAAPSTATPDLRADRFEPASRPPLVALSGGPSLGEAIASSEAILNGGPISRVEGDGARTVVQDAPDSNDPGNTDPSSWRFQQAAAQVQANGPCEQAALAKLSPDDQARYASVMKALGGNPVAQLGLQAMLLEGRLPGSPSLRAPQIGVTMSAPGTQAQPQTLLQILSDTAHAAIPPAVGKASDFLGQLTLECAEPDSIDQQDKGTCGPTSMEIALARSNPAEYARVVAELATNGRATFANGTTLDATATRDDGSGRSIPQRLLAPVLMQAGLTGFAYDNASDQKWFILPLGSGMGPAGLAGVGELLFGRHFDGYSFLSAGLSRGYAAGDVEARLASGASPVIAAMDFPVGNGQTGGHYVLVTAVKDGFVSYTNPWGQEEQMTVADFERYAKGVICSNP